MLNPKRLNPYISPKQPKPYSKRVERGLRLRYLGGFFVLEGLGWVLGFRV